VFLRALDALPIPDPADVALYRRATGRQQWPTTPASAAYVTVGRRSGKSRIASLLAVYTAAFTNWKARTAPGETAIVAVLAADKAQARTIFGYARGLVEASPLLRSQILGDKTDTLTFATGSRVEVMTSDYKSLRGRTFALVLADELAFWEASGESSNPDVEVLRAAKPGLMTLNGRLIGLSSPYAQRGALHSEYKKHWGRDDSATLIWGPIDSLSMNSSLSAEAIEAAIADDPEAGAAEWLGQFRSDLADLFSPESLAACTAQGRTELPPSWTSKHTAAIDAAGGAGQDSFAFAIAHQERRQGVVVVDCVREFRPPFDPLAVVAQIAQLAKLYGCRALVADKWGGGFVVESFAREGIAVEHSELTTSDTFLELVPLVNAHLVEICDSPRLLAQLSNLQRSTGRGRDHVEHRRGQHDDLAAAMAGAVVRAAVGLRGVARRLGVEFSTEKPTVEHVAITEDRATRRGVLGMTRKPF
jgi:hypothetical protein